MTLSVLPVLVLLACGLSHPAWSADPAKAHPGVAQKPIIVTDAGEGEAYMTIDKTLATGTTGQVFTATVDHRTGFAVKAKLTTTGSPRILRTAASSAPFFTALAESHRKREVIVKIHHTTGASETAQREVRELLLQEQAANQCVKAVFAAHHANDAYDQLVAKFLGGFVAECLMTTSEDEQVQSPQKLLPKPTKEIKTTLKGQVEHTHVLDNPDICLYLVYESAGDMTLQSLLVKHKAELTAAAKHDLVLQLTRMVQQYDELGLLHGDLHPGNVMVKPDPARQGHYLLQMIDLEGTKRLHADVKTYPAACATIAEPIFKPSPDNTWTMKDIGQIFSLVVRLYGTKPDSCAAPWMNMLGAYRGTKKFETMEESNGPRAQLLQDMLAHPICQ